MSKFIGEFLGLFIFLAFCGFKWVLRPSLFIVSREIVDVKFSFAKSSDIFARKQPCIANTMQQSKQQNDNFIIFSIRGGIGKNILATAVVKAIKKQYSDMNIVVLTGYKDIWLYNPNVHRVYNFNEATYFHENFVKDKSNVKIFSLEPYDTENYILKKEHLISIWCNLFGIKYNNEHPELFFNQREIDFMRNTYIRNEPIFLIQTNGGGLSDMKYSWVRDLPINTAQEVVENFRGEARIIQVRREDQLALNDVEYFNGSLRNLLVLIRESKYRLFIDSMCQHAAAALEKKSTVCWVRNHPSVLGYSLHDNIITTQEDKLPSLMFSLLEPYDISGNILQCPFEEGTTLFDSKEIIESVRSQA